MPVPDALPRAHPAVVERIREVAAEPTSVDPIIDRWMVRFTAVADRKLRRVVLGRCLEESDDGTLLGAILRLEQRAKSGEANCRWMETELALTPSLLLELPYDRVAELYLAAREADQPDLARRFYGDRPPLDGWTAENPHLDRSAGERTALARQSDRATLDRVAFDRDPRVIAALLDNPRITERDAIRVAAQRPTNPEVLRVVAAHPRWSQRYRVRKALAFNPATPTTVARQLLPTLLRQDLADLAASRVLTEELREAVRFFLAGR